MRAVFMCALIVFTGCDYSSKNAPFVQITEAEYDVIFDVKYATSDNFMGEPVYKTPSVYLSKPAAEKLKIASEYAKKLGYKVKIFDGFRPLDVQQKMFDKIKDEKYVSDPKKGVATHTRGVAVDLTLVDLKTGIDLDMGTEFDSFEKKLGTEKMRILQKSN